MAHIRIRPNGRIQFDLHLYGQRFREGTKLEATPKNLKQAKTKLAKINAEITLGTFQYRQHFPHSKKVPVFEALEREQHPDHRYPFLTSTPMSGLNAKKPNGNPATNRPYGLTSSAICSPSLAIRSLVS